MIGQKRGYLEFIQFKGYNSRKNPVYLMRCQCGNEKELPLNKTTMNIKSCGDCLGNRNWKKGLVKPLEELDSYSTLRGRYKRDAKSRGYCFELTNQEFHDIVNGECFYCGSKQNSEQMYNNRELIKYTGIDRVDNSIGYVKSNCVPCCKDCNTLKKAVSKEIIEKAYNFLFGE